YFSGQAGASSTKELEEPSLFDNRRTFGNSLYDAAFNGQQYNGTLLTAAFSREARYYDFEFGYASFSPTFQAQNGFINRTDRRQFMWSQSISYYPANKWLTSGSFSVDGTWRYDFAGQFHE